MKIGQRYIPILLISLLLLVSQFAAAAHSAEHPFHTEDQSCEVFFSLERSGNGLVADIIPTPVVRVFHAPQLVALASFTPPFYSPFNSRAPPI